MPIRPSQRARYPSDWQAISLRIRARSGGRCECVGECGLHPPNPEPRRCVERNGEKATYARGKIVLTVAHRNHVPEDVRDENLAAFCQRCHLRYDVDHHRATAAETRFRRSPQLRLFGVTGG